MNPLHPGAEVCHPLPDSHLRERLWGARVSIIGCGGLGSNVAAMLVRSGVRRLQLIDFDRVTLENLNRQLFFLDQVGELKTEALAATLSRISADLDLDLVSSRATGAHLAEMVGEADVIVEAVDTAADKAMIIETCSRELPDIALVTVSGLAGYESANRITTERLADNLLVVGDQEADIREGLSLLASRVMVAAAHQAHAVIRLLLGCEEI